MQINAPDGRKKDQLRSAHTFKMPATRKSTLKNSVVGWLRREKKDLLNLFTPSAGPSTSSSFEWIKRRRPPTDFFQCTQLTDCALVVEGERLYVSKAYLATHSPYFEELFFGSSSATPIEIPIDGVKLSEFLDFLHALQPNSLSVEAYKVDHLLKLAHRFEAIRIINDCSAFLIAFCGTSEANLCDCVKLADRHSLEDVVETIISRITSIDLLNSLGDPKIGFSLVTRSTILNRILMVNRV